MGSIARTSNIERFIKAFGKKIEQEFQHLIGARITELSDKEVCYHVKGIVTLKKEGEFEEKYEIHHRWATVEEDATGEEAEDTEVTLEAYFKDYLKDKTITDVFVGSFYRDDEAYLIAVVEGGESIEIPVGFEAEHGEFSGIAKDILSVEEIRSFQQQYE